MVPRPNHPWRVVFMGTPAFAVPSLEMVIRGTEDVVGVVCQPDRPSGRRQLIVAPPVKQIALRHDLPVLQPATLRHAEIRHAVSRLAPDLIVVVAYGKLLPPEILDVPPHGCINVHASLLPRHRGAGPIQWAILAGDISTGVTVMQMNAEMDAGDILLQRELPIEPTDTTGTLSGRLARLGASALEKTIEGMKTGSVRPRPQDESRATLAPLVHKTMGRIDWKSSAIMIERAVRAFQPWPSAHTTLDGTVLKVLDASVDELAGQRDAAPGVILESDKGRLVVATGTGHLIIQTLQLAGHRALPSADFLRGRPILHGTILGG